MQLQSRHLSTLAATVLLSMTVGLTACSKTDEQSANAAAASAAEASAVPMTAAPADDQAATAVVNEDTAAADAGPEAASVAADTGMASATAAAGDDEALEGAADNSGMDKISENDTVIDNEPASPGAPRADDEGANVGNARVGQ